MKTLITQDLQAARIALHAGKVIGIPTETVYGLAANALIPEAVAQVFSIKQRPESNPLILHFKDQSSALPYVESFHEDLAFLAKHFCPGPLTFLLPKSSKVPDAITGGSEWVAIRFPSHPMFVELLSAIDFPIAAPSANKYGCVSPTSAEQVFAQLNGEIPMILDGGPCEFGLESTIVGIQNEQVYVLRLGSIDLDELASCLGYIPILNNHAENKPLAPGMVKYHYATKTPLFYLPSDTTKKEGNGFIFLSEIKGEYPDEQCYVLSKSGDLKEMGRNLYTALSEMDARGFKAIYIEKPAPNGLGLTILDRLNRATAKYSKM